MAIIPCAAMIALRDGSVLLVKHGEKAHHKPGTYGLPSGKIDPGETELQAAIREFREETGLTAKETTSFPGNFFTATLEMKDGSHHTYPWTLFLCTSFDGELVMTGETEPAWIEINEMQKLNLLPNVYQAVQNALQFLKN